MKIKQKILSVILVLAVINISSAKALHKFFHHQRELHTCINKNITHFHQSEIQHQDLICSFNILTNLLNSLTNQFKSRIYLYNSNPYNVFNEFFQSEYHYHFQLRGPPQ